MSILAMMVLLKSIKIRMTRGRGYYFGSLMSSLAMTVLVKCIKIRMTRGKRIASARSCPAWQ